MIVTNAFSLNMLQGGANVRFSPVTLEQARELVAQGFQSAVGHADTARLFSNLLQVDVVMNRTSISIPLRKYGEEPWTALVGQYSGPRLPEGTATLPQGAAISWWSVYIE